LLRRLGIDHHRPYDLRHTMATLMLADGENPKVVQERLGHSSVTLTLDTYSSVLPGIHGQAAERLAARFAPSRRAADRLAAENPSLHDPLHDRPRPESSEDGEASN
jgi:integrase